MQPIEIRADATTLAARIMGATLGRMFRKATVDALRGDLDAIAKAAEGASAEAG